MAMTQTLDANLHEIIRLQLKKPKRWNWELTTSKSSPQIALPIIQLYNSKGLLLLEALDTNSMKRQTWHSSQTNITEDGYNRNENGKLQRCRSDNTHRRYATATKQSIIPEQLNSETKQNAIQRCKSDTFNGKHINYGRNRDKSRHTLLKSVSPERDINYNHHMNGSSCDDDDNNEFGNNNYLRKSSSDILQYRTQSNKRYLYQETLNIPQVQHKIALNNNNLYKKVLKYNAESLRRAEIDGYKQFLNTTPNNRDGNSSKRELSPDKNTQRRKNNLGAPEECIISKNVVGGPQNFVVNKLENKKYTLRQSRAGILVISEEPFDNVNLRRRRNRSCTNELRSRNEKFPNGTFTSQQQRSQVEVLPSPSLPSQVKEHQDKHNVNRTITGKGNCATSKQDGGVIKFISTTGIRNSRGVERYHSNEIGNRYERNGDMDLCPNNSQFRRNEEDFADSLNVGSSLIHSKSDIFPVSDLIKLNNNNGDERFNKTKCQNKSRVFSHAQNGIHKNSCDENATKINNCSKRKKIQTKIRIESSSDSDPGNCKQGHSLQRGGCHKPYHQQQQQPVAPATKNKNRLHQNTSADVKLLQLVRCLSDTKTRTLRENTLNNTKSDLTNHLQARIEPVVVESPPPQAGESGGADHDVTTTAAVVGMGANVSRHSAKGLSGRRSQSSGNICNGNNNNSKSSGGSSVGGRSSSRQQDGSGKICSSLPSYLDDEGGEQSTTCNNNCDKPSLDEVDRIPPLGDGAPLHWKFSDTQTALCDQGYGSERSPEEEYPPPLPDHDVNQCHHHLDQHACYPFITPESTFTVKLNKGSRGLGLSVTGGIDSGGSWPGLIRVKRLFPHQPASTCGLLNVGDLLLEVNNITLTGLTNYEALEVLRAVPNQVELKICRPPPDVLNCVSPISDVPPPPPTRREPPHSLNLPPSPSPCCDSTPEDEHYHGEFEVTLIKIQGSLGFTLRKEDDSALGHYVRALVREPALTDGRIRAGDKIIVVNGVEISHMSHEQAVQYLRQCGEKVQLRLYRDSAQTPVAALSPTETTPRASFSRKANLRQEAVDMLNDIAVRKLLPPNLDQTYRRSVSPPTTSSPPRRLRRNLCSSNTSHDSTSHQHYEEQFHEGLISKCSQHINSNFEEDAFNSLFTVNDEDDNDDDDRPSRPSSLDLYNPNQTPVVTRKPRFNFSLAHNAYELNNLDPEVLDAPNLTYNLGSEDAAKSTEVECGDSFPQEAASMPYIPLESIGGSGHGSSAGFSYKNPAYQSAHPQCVGVDTVDCGMMAKTSSTLKKRREKVVGEKSKNMTVEKPVDAGDIKTNERALAMREEYEILSIELNRGWNSRMGFSLQGAAGVTYVSDVHPDTVAAKDGRIKPGDTVIKVNDESVEHMSTNEIIDLLRIVRGPVCIVVKRIKPNEDCPNHKSNAEN